MSPRRNTPRRKEIRNQQGRQRPHGDEDSLFLRVTGGERRETGPDGEWVIRRISGAAAAKSYRCPGCYQEIPPGKPHVVAWRPFGDGTDRRHWHSSCWDRRSDRGVRMPRH
ncbi:ATP/GTP-binding protein [Allosalinactinospora lopnorensis]|uniref:ATP/GTP-binding protein n=1 Tax=Allosalinactinospora lopnorensis TaxID=1352348 RepID=UPI000AA40BD5|nr:ATP/GTP-binding protein [Allosalinactinospora lopnorensis]